MNEMQPKTSVLRQILKIIVVLVVLIGIGATVLYTQKDVLRDSPALKLTIITELNDSTELPMVTNLTMEQTTVPFYYKKGDYTPKFPEITVETKIGSLMSPPAGYRAGAFRPVEGEYNVTITFRNGSEPKTGDLLIMAVRLSDFRGAVIKKTTAFYEWK